ncbi:MAG TPA: type I-A CRISPR-associated protein Cas4/Csa1 [Desulfotomaculum sp.]|nr:type I-A CRISPR-associated protein Cas4/Csa1 [Desulfotomaculum sp.]
MYFFTDEEKKNLYRGLLPKAREMGVADELRGWNWPFPPLAPIYDVLLAIYEVAGAYCPTGRDLYLRRVKGIKTRPNLAMQKGTVLHGALAHLIVAAKRIIYEEGVANYQKIVARLNELPPYPPECWPGEADPGEDPENYARLLRNVKVLTDFEKSRLIARIQEILVKQPYIGEDSLVSLAIPVVVEQKLDGSFLGLSPNLSTDAVTYPEPVIVDLKFGRPQPFHRLNTTGYALVMESLYEFPVNLGCLVYAEFKDDRLLVRKDLHIISDELRQRFCEVRDEKARLVAEEIDPGVPENCPASCPYFPFCR